MPDNQSNKNVRRGHYLAKAAEARQNAERAKNAQERAQWEQIASVWEYVAKHAIPDQSEGS
jgi:hypothetical protein